MKIISLLAGVAVASSLLLASSAPAHAADTKKAEKTKKPQLRHVVSFKFKASATPEQIKKVEQAFADLPNKITQIKKFEWGINNSPEKHNKGCTHCFILTFKSEKDRNDYLEAPAHKEFGSLVGPVLDDLVVIDFWTKE